MFNKRETVNKLCEIHCYEAIKYFQRIFNGMKNDYKKMEN